MKTRYGLALVLALTIALAAPAEARTADDRIAADVARARRATARFHDVRTALRAGYVPITGCVSDPEAGAMGIHLASSSLMSDRSSRIEAPELLLYLRGPGGHLRLVGVEYWVADDDQDLATDADRPSLFGQRFSGPMLGHVPGQPIHFDLHAWIWRHNPAGMFASYNPALRCPGVQEGAGA